MCAKTNLLYSLKWKDSSHEILMYEVSAGKYEASFWTDKHGLVVEDTPFITKRNIYSKEVFHSLWWWVTGVHFRHEDDFAEWGWWKWSEDEDRLNLYTPLSQSSCDIMSLIDVEYFKTPKFTLWLGATHTFENNVWKDNTGSVVTKREAYAKFKEQFLTLNVI